MIAGIVAAQRVASGGTSAASLLHFNGADGSTTFTDESGKSWSVSGNAQIDTAQSKFGGASGLFDGANDLIFTPLSYSDLAFGTGDFTLEMFVRHAVVATAFYFDYRPASVNGAYPCLFANANGSLSYFVNGATAIAAPAGTVVAATWHHIAVCRSGGSTRLFRDGVQVGATFTDATNYALSALTIGAGNQPSSFSMNGHIDEFRALKGTAAYTATFTPPTAPFT